MKTCIPRKVVFRPADSERLTWAIVLCQSVGLSLLYVPRRSNQNDHAIAIATENVEERLFEPVPGPQFSLEEEDLAAIGTKLSSLGEAITEAQTDKLLEDL